MTKNGRQAALEAVYRINEEGAYSNLVLNHFFKKYNLTALDRGLATELTYGSLRMRNHLDWILNQFADRKVDKMDRWTRNILRLGLYQIRFLDSIPDAVACNETVELAKEYQHSGAASFVNGILRNLLRNLDEIEFSQLESNPVQHIRYKYSFPQWMVETWVKRYGVEAAIDISSAFNQIPSKIIRQNRLKVTAEELKRELAADGIEVEAISEIPQAFKVTDSSSLFQSNPFTAGYFQIQGLASILTGHILSPQPEERVLDLCSAPGGKTTHLAELMDNQGKVVANDLHEDKLELIERNCGRLGIEIVTTQAGDGRSLEFEEEFDRILVDAPCSGLGMIAKKPEIKWQKKPQDIDSLVKLQLELLNNASRFLKSEGELVYSTCTITQKENLNIINQFLTQNPDFELVDLSSQAGKLGISSEFTLEGSIQLLPTWRTNEGFFIAKLRQKV